MSRFEIHQGLCLTRRPGQTIQIGDSIQVTVSEVRGEQVRLKIRAPKEVRIMRSELLERTEHPETKLDHLLGGRGDDD